MLKALSIVGYLGMVGGVIAQFATGLLLVIELFNTAVEQLCDFVQPDYDERIGAVKDVAAAAAGTGMVFWLAVMAIEAVRLILQLR